MPDQRHMQIHLVNWYAWNSRMHMPAESIQARQTGKPRSYIVSNECAARKTRCCVRWPLWVQKWFCRKRDSHRFRMIHAFHGPWFLRTAFCSKIRLKARFFRERPFRDFPFALRCILRHFEHFRREKASVDIWGPILLDKWWGAFSVLRSAAPRGKRCERLGVLGRAPAGPPSRSQKTRLNYASMRLFREPSFYHVHFFCSFSKLGSIHTYIYIYVSIFI